MKHVLSSPSGDPSRDDTYAGDKKKAWERDLRRDLGSRDDDTLDAFAARWQARYDEIEATRGTITGRAGSLILFVGVLTTGAGLIAQSLSGAPGPVVALFIIVGLLLLYSGMAAAVLAVRAQRVGQWDSPRIDVGDAVDQRSVRLKYAAEIYLAAEQNQLRLRRPVGMLRDGQLFAMAGIVLIAVLAVLSVLAAILKPPAAAVVPAASPAPSVSSAPPSPQASHPPSTPSPKPSPAAPIPSNSASPAAPTTLGPWPVRRRSWYPAASFWRRRDGSRRGARGARSVGRAV